MSSGVESKRRGDYVQIDSMWIPPDKRRQGHGRMIYQKWEETIPRDVTHIRLMPVDFGHGPPDGFWRKMGFEYPYDGSKWMVKGVNGYEAPRK